MKTYRNEHILINVECNVHLLQQTWVGLPTSENFRDGSLATMDLARRHQIKRWLIDLRQLRLFNPMDLHWFIQQWLPQVTPGLLHQARVAVILNDLNQFSKLGTDLIIRASTTINAALSCRYFVSDDDCRQWLFQNS